MKIAIISDIHANLQALRAVLEDAHKRNIDSIWNIGDTVGYGAFPNEVVELLRQENAQSIIGNYDSKVLKVKDKKDKWKNGNPPEKWVAYNWAYKNLSKENREYLKGLPSELKIEVEGRTILITHGSPESDEEALTPETPIERFNELAIKSESDIVIFGHSHIPLKLKAENTWFINPGSVGRQADGDQRACYAILNIKQPKLLRIDHYRVEYDVESAVDAIHNSGLPKLFADMIINGRSFDEILNKKEKSIDEKAQLELSIQLAKSCGYESDHSEQVTSVALNLFDKLLPLHGLKSKERFLLQNAAIMHDIGWIGGQKGHHKTALRIILEDPNLLFDEKERLMIGSIVRYHRATLPKKKHSHYASLDTSERKIVGILAGILRVADGLDRTHQRVVKDIDCDITMDRITIKCNVIRPSEADRQAALDKSQLLEKVFNRKVSIEWQM